VAARYWLWFQIVSCAFVCSVLLEDCIIHSLTCVSFSSNRFMEVPMGICVVELFGLRNIGGSQWWAL
jgi:hypothetical protein